MSSKTMWFERLLEAVPDALVGMDQKGIIRFVNAQTESLFGYDRDEVIGQPITVLVPETLWQIYAQHRKDYFADPRTRSSGLDVELSGRHHNGGEFPVHVSMSSMDTGDVLLVIAGVGDVATWQWAVRNAGLVEAIVECSDDAIVGLTIDGTVTTWNPAAERMYGYSPKEVIGRSDRLIPQERAGEMDAVLARIRDGHVEHAETMLVRKDATVVPVSITAAPIRDEDGTVVGASAVHRDVSEQRRAFETAQRMAAIVEGSDDAIIGLTLEGVITSWNPAAERLYGYSGDEIIGRPVDPLVPEDRTDESQTVTARVKAGEPVMHLDTEGVRKDGTVFPVSLTLSPICDPDRAVVGISVISHDVTGQRNAFETAQRMAAIVEGSDDAIFASTLSGTITSWNRAAERLFGYPSQEMIGQSGRVLNPKDRSDEIRTILAKVGAGEIVEHLETIRIRKDGSVFPVSLTVSPIRDVSGRIIGASAISRNMTELRHAGLYARSLIEAAPDPMMTISPEGKINDVNEAAIRVTGVPRDELIATDFSQYFTDPDKARSGYEQTFTQGSLTDYSLTVRHRDGALTDLACNASVYRGFNGEVLGVFVAGRDVTQQRKAFEATQRLASIVEYSQDAIISGSLDGNITSWNPAAERLFGYSSKDIVGKPETLLAPKDGAGEVQDTLDKVKAGRHVKEFETIRVRKDGTVFPISLTVSPTRDADGAIIGTSMIYRDLTEQKRAEQALEQDRDLLRATKDSLLDPHVLLEAVRDKAGQIVDFEFADANPAACEYAQKTYGELIGSRLSDLFPDAAQPGNLVYRYGRVVETGEPLELDDYVYRQGLFRGQERRYDIRAAKVGNRVTNTWRDVTERQAAAQWLAESEEHYRLLAENASDVVMRLSPDLRYEWVSGSIADVLGWKASDLHGHVIDEFVHPDDLALFQNTVAGSGPEGTARTEFRFRRSDGSYRWMLCHTRLKSGEDGAPVALVGGLVDIDARKGLEAQELDRLAALERLQTVGRELEMIELKKEIESLRSLAHKDGDESAASTGT